MVFNVTVRGLNNLLRDPNFMLPSMGSLLMILGKNIHMVNIDVGEMFYMENYCRVDLGSYLEHNKDHQRTPLWMR